jgi:hypothetical protein
LELVLRTRAHGAGAVGCELLEIPGRARAVEETAQAVLCLVFFFFGEVYFALLLMNKNPYLPKRKERREERATSNPRQPKRTR